MSSRKLQEKIEKIEQQKKAELEKIEQLKRQQLAAKQKLRTVQSAEKRKEDTKLRILMGSYLMNLLKADPRVAQGQKSKIRAFCAAERNENARAKNLQIIDSFFNDLENKKGC